VGEYVKPTIRRFACDELGGRSQLNVTSQASNELAGVESQRYDKLVVKIG